MLYLVGQGGCYIALCLWAKDAVILLYACGARRLLYCSMLVRPGGCYIALCLWGKEAVILLYAFFTQPFLKQDSLCIDTDQSLLG